MAPRHLFLLYLATFVVLSFLTAKNAVAQSFTVPVYASNLSDAYPVANAGLITTAVENNAVEKEVLKNSAFAERQRLMGYLKALKIGDDQQLSQPNKKFYYHLANVFARLRLYPLAMKCFLKATPDGNMVDTEKEVQADTTENDAGLLTINSKDDALINGQITANASAHLKSKAISYHKILENFDDGKPAAAYALLFHVKQPIPGKRKIFVWGNTGHTFITLIKYNKDSSFVSASFGFYPKKDQLLSATPLSPITSSTFKDDAGHGWDEVIGKFISKNKFEKILKLTKDFDGIDYNLNKRNCTDFGLQAAGLAGITVQDTFGSWPLGKGNNPAITGQSLLKGKVSDDDNELFSTDQVKK